MDTLPTLALILLILAGGILAAGLVRQRNPPRCADCGGPIEDWCDGDRCDDCAQDDQDLRALLVASARRAAPAVPWPRPAEELSPDGEFPEVDRLLRQVRL